jgi:hypothetical protein
MDPDPDPNLMRIQPDQDPKNWSFLLNTSANSCSTSIVVLNTTDVVIEVISAKRINYLLVPSLLVIRKHQSHLCSYQDRNNHASEYHRQIRHQ